MAHTYGNDIEVVWSDRKRWCGLPLSFTKYSIIKKEGYWIKLVREMGFLHREVEEVQMYRIDDTSVYRSMTNMMWGVGTIDVYCNDASCNVLKLERVKNPNQVRNIINDLVEEDRRNRNVRQSEIQH